MLKDKKLEYQSFLEEYLEDQKVFDIFEDMMKSLIMQKPKDPIQFLIKKLTSQEVKRFIIVGPPGCKRKEIALSLAEYLSEDLSLVCISVGDLLNKEISKKSEYGKQIVDSRKTYSYVKDDIVTELVKGQIEALEKDQKSWIIEGFPRTRKQALALQKMGIILDKFLLLDVANGQSIEKVTKNLKSEEAVIQFRDEVIDQFAENALTEYRIQIEGVKETCRGSIIEIDGNRQEGVILEEIVRTLKLSRSSGPRRPPRIFIMGPPGCGKTQHAQALAQKFQLQYVKVKHIIKDLIRTEGPKSQRAKELRERLNSGDSFPDDLIIDLVRERLTKPDCKINGYILDGCPTTPEQIMKLQELEISPSLVVALDQNDVVTYDKLEHIRYDPIDNRFYHLLNDKVPAPVQARLIQQAEHSHDVLKARLEEYNNFLATVENEYSSHLIRINAADEPKRIFLNLCEAVEKPVSTVKQKNQPQNVHHIQTIESNLPQQKQSKNPANIAQGVDFGFLAQGGTQNESKKQTSSNITAQHSKKPSKSNEKHLVNKITQGVLQKHRVEQEINRSNMRYESLQSKIKTKRRYQQSGSNLNIKENLYSPTSNGNKNSSNQGGHGHGNYEQMFNQTMIGAGLQNISLGLSERQHIDLSQTQNIDMKQYNTSNPISAQVSRGGLNITQVLKNNGGGASGSGSDGQNFDFGCSLRMPGSTKNSQNKITQDSKPQSIKGSFFGNQQLQDFMNNMNNVSANLQMAFPSQKQGSNSNNGSVKRKPSNQSSNNQIVPVLDMKKVSIKQFQNMMKQKAVSKRESKEIGVCNNQTQNNIRKQNETIPQNQLSNIADSALYKNLTQKLIQEQQQQSSSNKPQLLNQTQNFVISNTSNMQNVNTSSGQSSKYNLMKKQSTPSNKQVQQQQQQQQILQQQQQNKVQANQSYEKRIQSNSKNKNNQGKDQMIIQQNQQQLQVQQQQSIPTTATNKGHKSFVFDLTNQQPGGKKTSGMVTTKQANAKKKLNLTGTIPKGLLSPTNNSKKPKHSDYFDNHDISGDITFEPHQEPSSHPNRQIKKSLIISNDKSTLDPNNNNQYNIDYLIFQQQQTDKYNQLIEQYQNNESNNSDAEINLKIQKELLAQQFIVNDDYLPQTFSANNRIKLNQTTKVERNESFSPPVEQNFAFKNLQFKQENIKSQVFTSGTGQQVRKPSHQKTLTLPNANMINFQNYHQDQTSDVMSLDKNDCYEDLKPNDYKNTQKILSTGQTPRVIRQKKNSLGQTDGVAGQQKTDNITIRKKNAQQMQIKKKIQIQLDLSDDEGNCNDQNQFKGKETVDTYDFNKGQIEFDIKANQDMKLRTQKISEITKIINNELKEAKRSEKSQNKYQSQQSQPLINQNFSPNSANNNKNNKQNFFLTNQSTHNTNNTTTVNQNSSSNHQLNHTQQQPQPQSQISIKFQRRKFSHQSNGSKSSSRLSPTYSGKQSAGLQNQEEVNFPITAAKAIKLFMNHLTDYEKGEILDYKQIYYVGVGAKKIKGSPYQNYNSGYDDERGDYKVVMKDHIGFRWEVIEFLGKGSFGQALKCFDHKTQEIVAVKLIRNKKRFQHQAGVELKILQHLKQNDPDDQYNIIRIKDYLIFRKHLVISFELFSINLYEFIKNNNFQGVSLSLIRRFAIQMLQALKYLREESVIHCDLKPENILLKFPDKSGIKIIDFGSSCFQDERIYTYIQSRFYRAPEIVLGIPYTSAIDMWSFGCILVELLTGYPVFPGESEQEQLALIMELRGVPSDEVLNQSTRKKIFFDEETNEPILVPNSRGKVRMPNAKSLQGILKYQSPTFLDFIDKCLDWNPETRMTPIDALMHDWIIEGLPPKVLIHHQRILGLGLNEKNQNHKSQPHIRNQRSQPSQSTKAAHTKLNKTCLISEEIINQMPEPKDSNTLSKRGKSLNKTGMVVIDESEDLVDIDTCYFMQKKQQKKKKSEQEKQKMQQKFQHDMMIIEDEDENGNFGEKIKSKTTNLADLLYEVKNDRKKQHQQEMDEIPGMNQMKNKGKMFENTHDISKLKKNSFFSQNNLDDQMNFNDEDVEDEEDMEGILLPYDERDKQENGNKNNMNKKNKIPFSFLMHHYMKTNTGQQIVAQNPNVGFYKPQGKDIKMNNFIGAVGTNGANVTTQNKVNLKKGFVNMSSNI